MADKMVIPMIVLARYLESPLLVPALDPNYKTALRSYLGKDSTPAAFNTKILLKRGVHLHFVLPSALKKGHEVTGENGERRWNIRQYRTDIWSRECISGTGKSRRKAMSWKAIFIPLTMPTVTASPFQNSMICVRDTVFAIWGGVIPRTGRRPSRWGECGYFDRITALGAGNPMFSAYYPSCASVFGFYDSLEGVPADAALTYCVTGIYSNPVNDLFHRVRNADDMKQVMADYGLSLDGEGAVCQASMVFGVAGGIDLSREQPVPVGEINIGIGKSSAEALSAIISEKYFGNREGMERFLTSIQYDTAGEASSPDGDFKIDDDIHYRGFSRLDPIERAYSVKLPKDLQGDHKADMAEMEKQYVQLALLEREIGKMRRVLEYQKDSLYYLWELYMDAGLQREEQIKGYMLPLFKAVGKQRDDIYDKLRQAEEGKDALEQLLAKIGATLEKEACDPLFPAN